MASEYYNNSEQTFRTGLTLHNTPAPMEELPSFEKKKAFSKPVPKEFASAWDSNREGEGNIPDKNNPGNSGGFNAGRYEILYFPKFSTETFSNQRFRQELHPYNPHMPHRGGYNRGGRGGRGGFNRGGHHHNNHHQERIKSTLAKSCIKHCNEAICQLRNLVKLSGLSLTTEISIMEAKGEISLHKVQIMFNGMEDKDILKTSIR